MTDAQIIYAILLLSITEAILITGVCIFVVAILSKYTRSNIHLGTLLVMIGIGLHLILLAAVLSHY